MKKLVMSIMIILIISVSSIGSSSVLNQVSTYNKNSTQILGNGYGLQWMMDYGNRPWTDARYQGPQPIGDGDNDGKNELLISGRDCTIRVMKWDENTQTYTQVYALRPPLYLRYIQGTDREQVKHAQGDRYGCKERHDVYAARDIQGWLGLANFLIDIKHALEADEAALFRGDLSLDHPDGEGEKLATLLEYSGSAHWQSREEAHLTGWVAHQDANSSLACGWVAARSQGDFSSLSIARINHRDWLVEAGIDGVMQAISALLRDAVNF